MLKRIGFLILSMLVVFKHLFKKPVTLEYPEKKKQPHENFRGKPIAKGCVGCATCVRVCPTGAIKLHKNEISFDLKKCIFCGNCSYYCPKGAIVMSSEYELATDKADDLILTYNTEAHDERN